MPEVGTPNVLVRTDFFSSSNNGIGRHVAHKCWLCGSAPSDLHKHVVSRPALVLGRDENFGGLGAEPPGEGKDERSEILHYKDSRKVSFHPRFTAFFTSV